MEGSIKTAEIILYLEEINFFLIFYFRAPSSLTHNSSEMRQLLRFQVPKHILNSIF